MFVAGYGVNAGLRDLLVVFVCFVLLFLGLMSFDCLFVETFAVG